MKALERATAILGGQSALARVIKSAHPDSKVKQGHVYHWLRKMDGQLPAEYCVAVEYATVEKGEPVTRYELRPDVFGVLPSAANQAYPQHAAEYRGPDRRRSQMRG